jgi:hypothetical protein
MVPIKRRFDDRASLSAAVDALLDQHFNPNDIEVRVVTAEGERRVPIRFRTRVTLLSTIGGVIGVILGTPLAVLASLGIVPTFGIDVFPDTVWLATVQGFLTGGSLLAFIGGIAGLGFWQARPLVDDADLRSGHVTLAVRTSRARADSIAGLLARAGAREP